MTQHYRLKNGKLAAFRLATIGDAPRIWEMHQRLSETTIYKRYHRHYQPPLEAIEKLCQMNEEPQTGAVFIATIETPTEVVIGIAYYLVEDDPTAAELALLVEDQYQGYGLGRQMANHLGEYAITQGICTFVAYVLSTNEAVTRLIARSDKPFHSSFSHGAREFYIKLADSPEPNPIEETVESVVFPVLRESVLF